MEDKFLGLVADIGGTNGRFALVKQGYELVELQQYLVADFGDFASMLEAYMQASGLKNPLKSVLAVAGAVAKNRCRLTSSGWLVDGDELVKRNLFSSCLILNDFEALALALPLLRERDLRLIGGHALDIGGRKLVVGPGTGLGTAFLGVGGPVAGEGGHISFAPVNLLEDEVLTWFRQKFERVSVERLLSGEGLENLYRGLAEINGLAVQNLQAPEIMAKGLAGEGPERGTLLQFCAMLGSYAGDMALAGGCWGGVYIGGGIVPRMPELFASSPFRVRFEAKGRFCQRLSEVPSRLITHKTPALLGAAASMEA